MDVELLGYIYNDGGISNQKIALLGLMASAADLAEREGRSRIFLPKITNYDQHKKKTFQVSFGNVFSEAAIVEFAEAHGIQVEFGAETPEEPDYEIRHGWNYFFYGGGRIGSLSKNRRNFDTDIAPMFFRHLIPSITRSDVFSEIHNAIMDKYKINTVVQLRIEEDWFHHCNSMIVPHLKAPEHPYVSAEDIIAKVKESGVNGRDHVYVTCDEKYIFAPKWDIKAAIKEKTGVDTVWRSDILGVERNSSLSQLDSSLIDFEIAVRSEIFVGNSRSTFANLVSFERSARAGEICHTDYIYNHPSDRIVRRHDFGTCFLPTDVTDTSW